MSFSIESFAFLDGLAVNNNREWFNEHKKTFKTALEAPFIDLLGALSNRLEDAPRPLSGGKQTMFRFNRDVRFSEDKSPYKTNVSGLLTPSGTKSELAGLVYLHLEADVGFVSAGYFNLSPKQLLPVREAMIESAERFDIVLESLAKCDRHLADYGSLSSMPRGFSEHAAHRHAEHIKRKSILIKEDIPTKDWISGAVIDTAERLARDAMPLLSFAQSAR